MKSLFWISPQISYHPYATATTHLLPCNRIAKHCSDVIMGAMVSQITSLTVVYSAVYSGADQRKHQSSASLAFVRGFHWSPVTGEFPAQMATNADNVSIWWRHHVSSTSVNLHWHFHCRCRKRAWLHAKPRKKSSLIYHIKSTLVAWE